MVDPLGFEPSNTFRKYTPNQRALFLEWQTGGFKAEKHEVAPKNPQPERR